MRYLELAAVIDDDLGGGGAAAGAEGLDLLDDIHALNDTAEHNVLAIEPGGGHCVVVGEKMRGREL